MKKSELDPQSWLSRPALVWEGTNDGGPSSYWDDEGLLKSIVVEKPSNMNQRALSYASLVAVTARLVQRLRSKIRKNLSSTVNEEGLVIGVPVAVSIPEGFLLPVAITAVHALNEVAIASTAGAQNPLFYAILVPIEPTEPRYRLKHMLADVRPVLALVAGDCDGQRLDEIIRGLRVEADAVCQKGLYRAAKTEVVDFRDMVRSVVAECQGTDEFVLLQELLSRTSGPLRSTILDHERGISTDHSLGQKLTTPGAEFVDRASHIVFTSGSTGIAKGCVSSIRSLDHYLRVKNEAHHISEKSTVLLASALSFDPCLSDILATFSAGATLAVASRDTLRDNLSHVLSSLSVTHCLCTPTLWNTLAVCGKQPTDFLHLQAVVLGGEPISKQIVGTWARHDDRQDNSRCRLYSTFGVTEACVYQTMGEVFQNRLGVGQDVGRPFRGLGVRICRESDRHQLVDVDPKSNSGFPDGVGEVVLHGAQLDRWTCYLNRPELDYNFVRGAPDKMDNCSYRTGDRGYIDPSTSHLHILGRIQGEAGMVKFNGIRIELGEMEAAVVDENQQQQTAVVVDCLVVAGQSGEYERDFSSAVHELHAFCVLSNDCCSELGFRLAVPTTGALCTPGPLLTLLRARCKAKARVTPSAFVLLPRVPLSPTGKRDRRGVPSLNATVTVNSLLANANAQESSPAVLLREYGLSGSVVAESIADCLNLQPSQQPMLTTSATFSMLGGDSLAATRVVRSLYARHEGVLNTRFLGGKYGELEGPFAVMHILRARDLGHYVDWLDRHRVCLPGNTQAQTIKSVLDDCHVEKDKPAVEPGFLPNLQESESLELYNALLQATMRGHSAIAMGLLDVGADPNFGSHGGRLGKTSGRNERKKKFYSSPLHLACFRGDVKLVHKLLKNNAKFNSPDASALFPLHLAATGEFAPEYSEKEDSRRLECIKILLRAGAPITMKDGNKQTVLHAAARAGHCLILSYVMEQWNKAHGDNPEKQGSLDWRDSWLRTPVHWAVLNGKVDALKILLAKGCSPDPPSPRVNKRSSAAVESPMSMCSRVHGSSDTGLEIVALLAK